MKDMKLYEISDEMDRIIDQLFTEDEEIEGGVSANIQHELNQLSLRQDEKVEQIACYIKNLDVMIENLDAETKRLRARKESVEKRAKWLRQYVVSNTPEGYKLKSSLFTIYKMHTQSVMVDELFDLVMLHEAGLAERVVEYKPNKKEIKELLKASPGSSYTDDAGNKIMLQDNTSLVIR